MDRDVDCAFATPALQSPISLHVDRGPKVSKLTATRHTMASTQTPPKSSGPEALGPIAIGASRAGWAATSSVKKYVQSAKVIGNAMMASQAPLDGEGMNAERIFEKRWW